MKKLLIASIIASAIALIGGIGNAPETQTASPTTAYAAENYVTTFSYGTVTKTYTAPKTTTTKTYVRPTTPEPVKYSKNTSGFVTRMYNIVLGRNPDPTGLKNWTNKLNSKQASASDIVNGFFMSPEYLNKKISNSELVEDCYIAMLDRSSDPTGKNNWLSKLNIGMTSQAICKGFVGSSEFKNLCSQYGINPGNITLKYARDENFERTYFVYRLYANCLGRTPDMTGLENWCKSLKNGTTGTKIAQGFIFSDEYKGKHYSNSDFASMLYKTILGRTPDKSGLYSWTSQLNNGKSREFVTNGFLFSNEFKGQCSKAGITLGSKLTTPEDIAAAKAAQEAARKAAAEKAAKQKAASTPQTAQGHHIYRTETGSKYHYCNPCGRGKYYEVTLEQALNAGLRPCEKCVLH